MTQVSDDFTSFLSQNDFSTEENLNFLLDDGNIQNLLFNEMGNGDYVDNSPTLSHNDSSPFSVLAPDSLQTSETETSRESTPNFSPQFQIPQELYTIPQTTNQPFQLPVNSFTNAPNPPTKTTNRNKKRRKDNDLSVDTATDDTAKFVELPKEALLKMTSTEIDDYIRRIRERHPVTINQEKELKRVRRVIKNREYAQSSRLKKRELVEDLGSQLSETRIQNQQCLLKLEALETENRELKLQLAKIATAIKKDPEIDVRISRALASDSQISSPAPTKGASFFSGSILFVFLFSMALLFPFSINPTMLSTKSYDTGRALLHSEGEPVGLQLDYFERVEYILWYYLDAVETPEFVTRINTVPMEFVDSCESSIQIEPIVSSKEDL